MKKLAINSVLSVVAISLAAGFSTNAAAETLNESNIHASKYNTRAVTVRYAASDLSTQEGVSKVHSQIKRAAKAICGSTSLRETGGLSAASRNRECYQDAMHRAVTQIDSSQLAALHSRSSSDRNKADTAS